MERRQAALTVEGKPRKRRAPIDDWDAFLADAIRLIKRAGPKGLTGRELAAALDIGVKPSRSLVARLKEARMVHVGDWRQRARAYVFGDGPDAVPAHVGLPKRNTYFPAAEKLARKEIHEKHAHWCQTWRPTCDAAAAWLFNTPSPDESSNAALHAA